MSEAEPSGPLDVTADLLHERSELLELLDDLEPGDWSAPTECPAWDVQGVALHVLGDDLSLLSRQRDAATPGTLRLADPSGSFRDQLDRFNEQWVTASSFFSPRVLVDLLELTGRWTVAWYEEVDPHSLGEPVLFFGATRPAPYWQIAAHEYVERWVHHHQIRRALGRPDLGRELLRPAVEVVLRGLSAHLPGTDAAAGTEVGFAVGALGVWTFLRQDEGWQLLDGPVDGAAGAIGLDEALATPVLSRGLGAREARAALATSGDEALAGRIADAVAAMVGRP